MKWQLSQTQVSCLSNDLKTIAKLLFEQLMTTKENIILSQPTAPFPFWIKHLFENVCVYILHFSGLEHNRQPTHYSALTYSLLTNICSKRNIQFVIPSEPSGNVRSNNVGAPVWRNGVVVFWYGKHGHWLRGVNTSASAGVFSIVARDQVLYAFVCALLHLCVCCGPFGQSKKIRHCE